jgi:hypothetical protein
MILDEKLKEEIEKQGVSPEVLLFLMGWTGLIHSKIVDFMNEKYHKSYLKKIKRKAMKDGGKSFWEEIKKECLKPRLKMQLQKSLFKIEPKALNPPNRPKNYSLWLTVHYFQEYFVRCIKRPKWRLIANILFPGKSYSYVSSEWHKRRKWFEEDMSILPIKDLLRFYEIHKEKILIALNTGVPIYEQGSVTSKIRQRIINDPSKNTLPRLP